MRSATSLPPARLRLPDLTRLAGVSINTRRVRAALSALGIAIGVAALVAVVGLSSSSQAGLLAEIDELGTNLLTVTTGSTIFGDSAPLPHEAPSMIERIEYVSDVQYTGSLDANAYRNEMIPRANTNALSVQAASLGLPEALGIEVADGVFLNEATAEQPVAVLGAVAAQRLGIDQVHPGQRIWVGDQWFYVAGILEPSLLAPEIDTSVLIGFPAAETYLDFDGHPSTIYVRPHTDEVDYVRSLLAATANPAAPNEVNLSRPSDALEARARAQSTLTGLVLGLGAISMLVGGVGVANIMIIAVLERRSEIGLRRALGATKAHIRLQFLSEAILLGLLGGVMGLMIGVGSTAVYAIAKDWPIVIPTMAWAGGLGAALLIGAVAGLLPALKAAQMSPKDALWSV